MTEPVDVRMAEIIRRHVAGLPHPCDGTNHETHLTEEQREAAAWQRAKGLPVPETLPARPGRSAWRGREATKGKSAWRR